MGDAQFDADVAQASALLSQYGEWINRYRGGMPPGWMAAIMAHESGGNFGAPGDPSLGEVGFYQIASYLPGIFGYDAAARYDPETNVALASLEYALESVMWLLAFPQAVRLGSADAWKLARLAFAVGRAGSHQLATLAAASQGGVTDGDLFGDIRRWTQATGAVGLGSQSAAKVAQRVLDIDRQWAIGQAVSGGPAGPPTLIPDPPVGPYTLPDEVAPYFVKPLGIGVLLLVGGGVLLYLLSKRWR